MWVWRGSYDGLQVCCPGQAIFDVAPGFAEEVNGFPLHLLVLLLQRQPTIETFTFVLADSPSALFSGSLLNPKVQLLVRLRMSPISVHECGISHERLHREHVCQGCSPRDVCDPEAFPYMVLT